MDTPITVSSTSTTPDQSDFLQLNYSSGNSEESLIHLGSTSLETVPVKWKNKNVFKRTNSNATFTKIEAVSNWIKSIEEPEHDPILMDLSENIKENSFKDSTSSETISENFPADSKSVILFRCDFNKSVPSKTYYHPTITTFSRSPPVISHYKNENTEIVNNRNSTIPNNLNRTSRQHSGSNINKRFIKKNLLLKRSESSSCYTQQNKISLEKEYPEMNDLKSNGNQEAYEVPLSPESRKKELCSYLQLMNPADKKERFILQNRRSTRVRNLNAMQEKRKKMHDKFTENGGSEHLSKDSERYVTLKSFKELNIRVEKAKFSNDRLKEKMNENEVFCFPFPSKDLTENIQDFDSTMSKLVARYKRICRIKNLKLNCTVDNKSVKSAKVNLIKNIIKSKSEHKNNVKKKGSIVKIKTLGNREKTKERKLNNLLKKRYKPPMSSARANSLRSTGKLKNITLKKLLNKKERELLNRKKIRKSVCEPRETKEKVPKPTNKPCSEESAVDSKTETTKSRCEIITVPNNKDDSYIDIENLMDDMIGFENLSEEHKKCLIENRILSTKQSQQTGSLNVTEEDSSKSFYSLQEMSPLYGFNKSDVNQVKKMCEVYKNSVLSSGKGELIEELFRIDKLREGNGIADVTDELYKTETESTVISRDSNFNPQFVEISNNNLEVQRDPEEEEEECGDDRSERSDSSELKLTNGITLQDHDYAGLPSDDELEENDTDAVRPSSTNILVKNYIEISPRSIEKKNQFELLPYNKSVEMKSLHKSLQYVKRKANSSLADQSFTREWDSDNSSKQKSKKQSHYISINKQNGAVLKAFYIDFNLIVCQENVVSFWMQTPLGNVLGSQNMWIPRGQTQRLVLNGKCMQKESMEMVIVLETDVAYIELWTKEHKSDIREGPVADVFATIYFWKQRQTGLNKKVLQLENINGFADDVQYSVMKSAPKIIVSWHSAHEDGKRTFIHAYELASDYQTVANIHNIEPVDHYVSSLHNIEDCDSLIMGCGENKITLWNVEYGYIIATIVLEIKSPLSTLWVKCDRGFLFALQQCLDRELRLIAINGINHSWKKLASYIPPEGFDRLRGVCIENGLLLSFYDQGILCWKAETGEPVEETSIESDIIPSGKYVILIEDEQILVKHAMTHLMSLSIEET